MFDPPLDVHKNLMYYLRLTVQTVWSGTATPKAIVLPISLAINLVDVYYTAVSLD
jgi:hypothetical protein